MYNPIQQDTKAASPLPPLFWGGELSQSACKVNNNKG